MPSSDGQARELVAQIAERLRERGGEKVGFAESCTGGLISAWFTMVPGVSDVFRGSVVAYANELKSQMLDVSPNLLCAVGAVSVEVAREMARGARSRLAVEWSLAVTGVAGPAGGSAEKPVGTVCFALLGPGIGRVERTQFAGSRIAVQRAAALYALRFLAAELGVASVDEDRG